MCGKNHLKELGTGFDSEWRDPAHGTWLANRVWKKTKGWILRPCLTNLVTGDVFSFLLVEF